MNPSPQLHGSLILAYFTPMDQAIIRFMADHLRCPLDRLNGGDMLRLMESYRNSGELQAAFAGRAV